MHNKTIETKTSRAFYRQVGRTGPPLSFAKRNDWFGETNTNTHKKKHTEYYFNNYVKATTSYPLRQSLPDMPEFDALVTILSIPILNVSFFSSHVF